MRTSGNIVSISGYLGFVQIQDDKNWIPFDAAGSDFKIGDIVEFDVVLREVPGAEESIEEANGLILKERPESRKVKLAEASQRLNVSIVDLIEKLEMLNGQIYETDPENTIPAELFESISKVYLEEKKIDKGDSKPFLERFPIGTILETSIIKKINPGTLAIYIDDEVSATVSILDLAWNLARAELLYSKYKEGDQITVVVLDYSRLNKHVRLSIKHLLPKPSETELWKEVKLGNVIAGQVIDNLYNRQVVELENGLIGVYNGPKSTSDDYQVIKKDKLTNLLVLSSPTDFATVQEEKKKVIAPASDIKTKNVDLRSHAEFSKSIFADFAEEEDLNFIKSSFEVEPDLFSKEVVTTGKILMNFEFDSNAWSSFQSQIVPGLLNVDNSMGEHTKKAISDIELSSFWIRISQKRNSELDLFTIYNDKLNFHGGITMIDEDACHFNVFNVSFGRVNKMAGNGKKNGAKHGSFLLINGVSISPPEKNIDADSSKEQLNLYGRLKIKHRAFEILEILRVKTGEIMRSEGEALQIFDKFLEYQEYYTRSNQPPPVELKDLKRSFGGEFVSWELPPEVSDYLSDQEEEVYLDLREKVKSTKKGIDFEYKKIGSAKAVEKLDRWSLLVEDSLPLDEVKDLYIQKKASVRQFQIQREIIRDFFDKKLRLDHIENLLVRPERIIEPMVPDVDFKNPFLISTEKEQQDNNQVRAVKKAIGNQNIFLIQGPPGTGKTTVIAEVVKQLVDSNEKILVASQTHIAVDNVLEKLASEQEMSLLRIGSKNRILESVKHFHPSEQIKLYTSDFEIFIDIQSEIIQMFANEREHEEIKVKVRLRAEEYSDSIRDKLGGFNYRLIDLIHQSSGSFDFNSISTVLDKWKTDVSSGLNDLIAPLLYSSVDVVFSTCIGIKSDRDFEQGEFKFDTVIIDEAGKANLAESLVAVSMAKKVILVGDQMQLPPYIDGNLIDPKIKGSFPGSKYGHRFLIEDIEHALKTSFFEFLVNRIKANEFPTTNMEMLNYQHRMHPNIGQFVSKSFYGGEVNMGSRTHLNRIELPPPFDKEVTFINTGSYHNPYEDTDGYSARNKTEASTIVQSVLPQLRAGGLQSSEIAVIAPYKSQVALIKKEIDSSQSHELAGIEVSTLDSFQGMEFDVIVFSFTRSAKPEQENKKVGFLDDARRLNVAFSRAKKKLILIGNASTLTHRSSHFDRLFNYTNLFKSLVELSKDPNVGQYCDMTDFKSLKSPFERFKEDHPLGSTAEGIVKGIAAYGIFVTIDGQDGLVHVSNLSYEKVNRVSDLYETGQPVKVKIINFDESKNRIEFGIKQLSEKASRTSKEIKKSKKKGVSDEEWGLLKTKLPVGDTITVPIANIVNFGVFIKLSEEQDGLVHVTQLDPLKRKDLESNYIVGSDISVLILNHDDDKKRVELSESLALLKMKGR